MTGQQHLQTGHSSPNTPSNTLVAAIAQTVGTVLAHASETAETHQDDADEIRAITQAMVRLLVGIPLRSDGQLTVKALAEEAGLRRNKLTHKHTGLKDLFYALVRTQETTPRIAHDIGAENDELKARLQRVTAERDNLKNEVQQFARIVHVLEVENDQLRQQANQPTAEVHFLLRDRTR